MSHSILEKGRLHSKMVEVETLFSHLNWTLFETSGESVIC